MMTSGRLPVNELKELKDLLDENIIDRKEFDRMKNEIMQKRSIPVAAAPIPMANKTLEGSGDQAGKFMEYMLLLVIIFVVVFVVFFVIGFAFMAGS